MMKLLAILTTLTVLIILAFPSSYASSMIPFRPCGGAGYIYIKFDDSPTTGTIDVNGQIISNGQSLLIGCGSTITVTADPANRFVFLQWTSNGGGFFVSPSSEQTNSFYVSASNGGGYTITAQSTNTCTSLGPVATMCYGLEPQQIGSTAPQSVRFYKDTYLNYGLSTSNLCNPGSNYKVQTLHSAPVIGSFFSSQFTGSNNQYPSGDTWTEICGPTSCDMITDNSGAANIWQNYTLLLEGQIQTGRSYPVQFISVIVYNYQGGGCKSYSYQNSTTLSS